MTRSSGSNRPAPRPPATDSAGAPARLRVSDPGYPPLLRELPYAPPDLYLVGDPAALASSAPAVAVVGCRGSDRAGDDFASYLGHRLASAGVTVVSGLAHGIDAAAHEGALRAGRPGAAVAVLGNALPGVYPAANRDLARRVTASGGVLVSQFPPGSKTYPANFLARNHVIAGLSLAVVVVQAASRSGSIATARAALDAGRDVLAVPGAPWDPRSAGTNDLIRQGAYVVTSAEDVLALLPSGTPGPPKTSEPAEPPAGSVLSLLRESGPLPLEDLLARHPDPAAARAELLELEVDGTAAVDPGGTVRIRS